MIKSKNNFKEVWVSTFKNDKNMQSLLLHLKEETNHVSSH